MIHLVNKLINFGFTRTDAQVYISLLKTVVAVVTR
ncbi:hypothetical protein BANRA_02875 [Escherichia coli]|uniref:Uncharacterized protein n=1 Tax=Escherichia coli TaxID=562 RepID=A0A3P4D6W0_ECOLX|nr:hypothetical protein BANRA_02875 [Escherichia coli]VCV83590.1 hypothetical protein BANRA_01472 [Escherichia coli]VCY83842.1 hypothetical protein BANRA_02504 [Escherichia coli]